MDIRESAGRRQRYAKRGSNNEDGNKQRKAMAVIL
jgi:hypothetical protein